MIIHTQSIFYLYFQTLALRIKETSHPEGVRSHGEDPEVELNLSLQQLSEPEPKSRRGPRWS